MSKASRGWEKRAPVAAAVPAQTPLGAISSFVESLNESEKASHRATYLHLMQSLTGCSVNVEHVGNVKLTGVMHSITPFEGQPHCVVVKGCKVQKEGTTGVGDNGKTAILDFAKVVTLQNATKLDLVGRTYSTDFQTDSSIKKHGDMSHLSGRNLKSVDNSWLESTGDMSLEGKSSSGKTWDQFETNRRLFNVKDTYDENLYTKKLDLKSMTSAQIANADRLAREIEGTASSNIHLQEERGQATQGDWDEEDRFSGVLKSGEGNSNAGSRKERTASTTPAAAAAAAPDTSNPWKRNTKLVPGAGAPAAAAAAAAVPAAAAAAPVAATAAPVAKQPLAAPPGVTMPVKKATSTAGATATDTAGAAGKTSEAVPAKKTEPTSAAPAASAAAPLTEKTTPVVATTTKSVDTAATTTTTTTTAAPAEAKPEVKKTLNATAAEWKPNPAAAEWKPASQSTPVPVTPATPLHQQPQQHQGQGQLLHQGQNHSPYPATPQHGGYALPVTPDVYGNKPMMNNPVMMSPGMSPGMYPPNEYGGGFDPSMGGMMPPPTMYDNQFMYAQAPAQMMMQMPPQVGDYGSMPIMQIPYGMPPQGMDPNFFMQPQMGFAPQGMPMGMGNINMPNMNMNMMPNMNMPMNQQPMYGSPQQQQQNNNNNYNGNMGSGQKLNYNNNPNDKNGMRGPMKGGRGMGGGPGRGGGGNYNNNGPNNNNGGRGGGVMNSPQHHAMASPSGEGLPADASA